MGVDVGRAGLSADGLPESRVSTARIEEHFNGLVQLQRVQRQAGRECLKVLPLSQPIRRSWS